ncbi:UNVERIFIED_CONTAM: hypothetical protein FKN15_069015 [Acipenser sinensis]
MHSLQLPLLRHQVHLTGPQTLEEAVNQVVAFESQPRQPGHQPTVRKVQPSKEETEEAWLPELVTLHIHTRPPVGWSLHTPVLRLWTTGTSAAPVPCNHYPAASKHTGNGTRSA